MEKASPQTLSRRTLTKRLMATVAAPAMAGAVQPFNVVRAQGTTTVTFWQFNTEDFIINAWKQGIAAFEQKNPDIKVNMEIVPWANQQQKLITGLTTGKLPDVSMLGNNVVAQFQALGALAPLTSYLKAWSGEVGHDVTQGIWPGDKLYYFLHNDWWGAPVAEETRCLYYRKDLLSKADIANPPGTWDEARAAAKKLTSGDVFGWGIPGGIEYATVQTFMSVYLGYGAKFLNDQGQCGFDSPEFRQALTLYTDLYTKDKVTPPDTPRYGNQQLDPIFQSGKMAMYITGPGYHTTLTDAKVSFLDQVGIAQIPAGSKGRFGFLGGWPLVLWKNAKNKDAAWKWIRFATDPAGYLPTLAKATGNLPGQKSIVNQAPWNEPPLDVFAKQLDFAYPYQYPAPEIPQMGSLEVDAVQTAVQSVMLGQKSVDEATKALVDRVNAALKR